MSVQLSVVMPVHNEEAVIVDSIGKVLEQVMAVVPDSELLVVDDASTDRSSSLLAGLAATEARLRVLRNAENLGHGPSVRRGFDAATGEWILQLDSDGQIDLADFVVWWGERGAGDLFCGVRRPRHDPRHRLVLTALVRWFVSVLARRRLGDPNAPCKLVRRSLVEHVLGPVPPDTFAPSLLLMLGAARSGARLAEVPVTHLPRAHGQSSLRLFRLARACALAGWQTLRLAVRPAHHYQATSASAGEGGEG